MSRNTVCFFWDIFSKLQIMVILPAWPCLYCFPQAGSGLSRAELDSSSSGSGAVLALRADATHTSVVSRRRFLESGSTAWQMATASLCASSFSTFWSVVLGVWSSAGLCPCASAQSTNSAFLIFCLLTYKVRSFPDQSKSSILSFINFDKVATISTFSALECAAFSFVLELSNDLQRLGKTAPLIGIIGCPLPSLKDLYAASEWPASSAAAPILASLFLYLFRVTPLQSCWFWSLLPLLFSLFFFLVKHSKYFQNSDLMQRFYRIPGLHLLSSAVSIHLLDPGTPLPILPTLFFPPITHNTPYLQIYSIIQTKISRGISLLVQFIIYARPKASHLCTVFIAFLFCQGHNLTTLLTYYRHRPRPPRRPDVQVFYLGLVSSNIFGGCRGGADDEGIINLNVILRMSLFYLIEQDLRCLCRHLCWA